MLVRERPPLGVPLPGADRNAEHLARHDHIGVRLLVRVRPDDTRSVNHRYGDEADLAAVSRADLEGLDGQAVELESCLPDIGLDLELPVLPGAAPDLEVALTSSCPSPTRYCSAVSKPVLRRGAERRRIRRGESSGTKSVARELWPAGDVTPE
ncbi:hypothetical protein [Streptomyces chrestomyceticus]|uniref:hypothetical protein n=1 Tax=Streptomyces chrestomyceticus TaxID=68185 RepID=UPI0035A8ACBA